MVSNSSNSTQRDAPRPVRLRRREASKYLFEEHGIEVAGWHYSIRNKCNRGKIVRIVVAAFQVADGFLVSHPPMNGMAVVGQSLGEGSAPASVAYNA